MFSLGTDLWQCSAASVFRFLEGISQDFPSNYAANSPFMQKFAYFWKISLCNLEKMGYNKV
jgi:hypothetical protein